MLLSRGSPGTIWSTKRFQGVEVATQKIQAVEQGQEGSLLNREAKLARFPHLPMVEDGQGKGLALGVSAEISLKAKRVDGWDESFDGVERGAWNGCILGHVPPERETKVKALVAHSPQGIGQWVCGPSLYPSPAPKKDLMEYSLQREWAWGS